MTSTGVTSSEDTATPPEPAVRPTAPVKQVVSLGQALNGSNNSLGLLRFVLASVVIFHHTYPLGGYYPDPFATLTRGQSSLGSLAVAGFFGISGYLIAKSGMGSDVVQFMWRRTLRVFPAYWVVLLVTAFVAGPLVWLGLGREFADYFTTGPGGPFHYFTANWTLTIGTYGIHDLLAETTPYGREINGSVFNGAIWTLYYEWFCYLIIAVLVTFGVLKKARIIVPVLAGFFLLMQVLAMATPGAVGAVIPALADPYKVSLGLTFLVGSTLAVYSKQIPFDNKLGVFSALVLLLSLRYGGFATVGTVAGVYFVMYLGARLPRQLHWIGAKNDYSYGIYIYGFLVQQLTAHLGWYSLGFFPYAFIALALTFCLAFLSWHLVEKRAMALKNWGPGRGWHYWYDRVRGRRALASTDTP
jgi:peptidoglycan/LPS O-acetylase OafA/YrhL